jgi:transposase
MEISEIKTLDDALAVIRQLLEIVKKQGDEIAKRRQENEKLRQENAWLKRQLFGSKAEHYIATDDTPSLFPEEESPVQPEESPSTTVSEHERTVRKENVLSEIPADLPREERVIDVPEDQRQGMKLIGYAESERIAYRTGLYVIHFKRAKCA